MSRTDDSRPLQTTIYDLPTDVLLSIFSYLNVNNLCRIAPVCKLWYELANKTSLWRHIIFQDNHIALKNVIQLLNNSPLLTSVEITGRNDVGLLLQQLFISNPNVTNLTLKRCQNNSIHLNDWECTIAISGYLKELLQTCPQLYQLELREILFHSDQIYNVLRLLNEMKPGSDRMFTPSLLIEIADNFSNLQELTLIDVYTYTDFPINKTVWDIAFTYLIGKCGKNLKSLNLDISGLSNEVLKELLKCPNLEALSFYNAYCLTSQGLEIIGQLCKLKYLYLHKNYVCQNAFIMMLKMGNLQTLTTLNIIKCIFVYDTCLEAIAEHCPNLKILSLVYCDFITDCGIEAILRGCRYLTYLNLYRTSNVRGASLLYIPLLNPTFKYLILDENCNEDKGTNIKELLNVLPNVTVIVTSENSNMDM